MYKKFLISVAAFSLLLGGYFFLPRNKSREYPYIDSFSQAEKLCQRLGPNDIVFFDVDDTLLTAQDHLARIFNPPRFFSTLACIRYPKLLNKNYSEVVFSKMLSMAPRVLTDKNVIEIINNLRKQGTKVFVITGMETGAFGSIANLPAWRSNMLEHMGISLDTRYPNTVFKNFSSYRNNYPCLYNGLICCNQQAKGDVIKTFLEHFTIKPEVATLFDDSLEELVVFQKTCRELEVTPVTYLYQGAQKIPFLRWSLRRAFTQLSWLIKKNIWLSDIQADEKLKQNFFSFLD